MEIWKDIIGYEGYYQISNEGMVKRVERKVISIDGRNLIHRELLMKFKYDKDGYRRITLLKDKFVVNKGIHRLVAEHFISNSLNLPCVNHLDKDKLNNNASNLEWCTVRENTCHGNKSKEFTSIYSGVYKDNKIMTNAKAWRAAISINGVSKYIGSFHTEIDAHNAYLKELNKNELTNKYI